MAMSVAEQLREEGRQQGLQEVRQERRLELFRETAQKIMQNFPEYDDETIAKFLSLPVEFVREIRREFLSR